MTDRVARRSMSEKSALVRLVRGAVRQSPRMSEPTSLYVPPDWAKNRACWLAWPSDADEWDGDLHPPREAVAALAAVIADVDAATGRARGERIDMLVCDDAGEDSARAYLGATPVQFYHLPFGDIWLRDTGPMFRVHDGQLGAACFAWNGWGDKYLFPDDIDIGERIAATVGARVERYPYILEGGAIECDGVGTAMTTRQCLLADNRILDGEPVTEAIVEARLAEALGIRHTIWLDRGLDNDHTDGHVDTLARFVAPGRVVCMRATRPDDPNRGALADIARALRDARDAAGNRLEVIEIPSPGLVRARLDGAMEVMPASYLNFYVGNTTVVVPTYGADDDARAVADIGALFPGRRTVGLDALGVITGGGAFHCISKQQPVV